MKFELIKYEEEEMIRYMIRNCQRLNHVQQVVFSTYHDCLTQICFTCKKIRTSLEEEKNK